jgi:hypothetical protein
VPELFIPDADERDDLGAFVARAVRLDQSAAVRLRARGGGRVDAWVATPFDALVTRSVAGNCEPADVTVSGSELLAALAVVGGSRLDPGQARDLLWHSALPPAGGWQLVDTVPASVLGELTERGVALAKENPGPRGTPPTELLDQTVLTVSGSGIDVRIPLRCLLALSGMGFVAPSGREAVDEAVKVSATDAWLRMDARFGAVVRRRHALLPLLV